MYCPYNTNGTYPNCTCDENATFVKDTYQCLSCPSDRYVIDSKTNYPNQKHKQFGVPFHTLND